MLGLRPTPSTAEAAVIAGLLDRPSDVVPVFQPIVELSSGAVIGYEALARFRGLDAGPHAVFAMAHRLGLGCALEALVIERALAVTGRPAGTSLALNCSATALASPEVERALSGDLDRIVVEITEHDLPEDPVVMRRELAALRRRGAQVAVDDAGAGYSGLQRILGVRPDVIKLDRTLVSEIDGDPAKVALVESFVRFARRTGARLVAEGIETLAELALLADLDVGHGQGYVIARPAPPWAGVAEDAAATCRARLADALSPPGEVVANANDDRAWEALSARVANATSLADLGAAADYMAQLLEAEEVAVSEVCGGCDDGFIVTLSQHTWLDDRDEAFPLTDFPETRAVLASGAARQVIVGDPAADPAELGLLEQAGYGSMLMSPVVRNGVPLGLIEIYAHEARPWTRQQITRARIICHQLGGVIDGLRTGPRRPGDVAALQGMGRAGVEPARDGL